MMAETFQAKHPNVKVDARAIGLDGGNQQSAYPKMLAMLQAGTLGEVHAWDPSHWQLYQAVKRNIIRPIDELIARDKFDLKQFYAPFIEYQKWQGKTWGLPSWGWTGQDGLLYNTELAQQAGVTFPAQNSPDWTMSKLYEIAVKMGKFAERTGGFGLRTTLPGAAGVTILTRAFNADNLSPDGKKSTLHGRRPQGGHEVGLRPGPQGEGGRPPGHLRGRPLRHRDAGDRPRRLPRRLQHQPGQRQRPAQVQGPAVPQAPGRQAPLAAPRAAPGTSWQRAASTPTTPGSSSSTSPAARGPCCSTPTAATAPSCARTSWTTSTSRTPTSRSILENFENTMVHVIPANLRGTEFEPAYNEKGPPWYKGRGGVRGRPQAVERRGAARPRPACDLRLAPQRAA